MNEKQFAFLRLAVKPARSTSEMAAWILGCAEHDIPVLVAANHLKPLGKPEKNGIKYFATVELLSLQADLKWLNKATEIIRVHWKSKNSRKKEIQDTVMATVP